MRGKNSLPSTNGSSVAAVDHAKSSGPSPAMAASAPAGVTAPGGGGQHGRRATCSTVRCAAPIASTGQRSSAASWSAERVVVARAVRRALVMLAFTRSAMSAE